MDRKYFQIFYNVFQIEDITTIPNKKTQLEKFNLSCGDTYTLLLIEPNTIFSNKQLSQLDKWKMYWECDELLLIDQFGYHQITPNSILTIEKVSSQKIYDLSIFPSLQRYMQESNSLCSIELTISSTFYPNIIKTSNTMYISNEPTNGFILPLSQDQYPTKVETIH
jgi:hypothetical protein